MVALAAKIAVGICSVLLAVLVVLVIILVASQTLGGHGSASNGNEHEKDRRWTSIPTEFPTMSEVNEYLLSEMNMFMCNISIESCEQ